MSLFQRKTWTYIAMASLPRLGKVFRKTQGLQVIDRNTCSLHYIYRDFTVVALCFERSLYQWPGKEAGGGGGGGRGFSGITVAKLCRYFIRKTKLVTG